MPDNLKATYLSDHIPELKAYDDKAQLPAVFVVSDGTQLLVGEPGSFGD